MADLNSTSETLTAIILAAGKGTRMAGPNADPAQTKPKVVYPVAGEPMVRWVVRACLQAGAQKCIVVVGFKAELVQATLTDFPQGTIEFVHQHEQLGTGHAARMAQPLFANQPPCDTFVLAGDGPLIRADTLCKLLQTHRTTQSCATLATALLDDPTGYGRIVRDANHNFQAIVEQKDCTPDQVKIREVNPSYYCFRSDRLFATLGEVKNSNKQGEYYLTDVPGLLQAAGDRVTVVEAVPPEDVLGINTPADLALVDGILRKRLKK